MTKHDKENFKVCFFKFLWNENGFIIQSENISRNRCLLQNQQLMLVWFIWFPLQNRCSTPASWREQTFPVGNNETYLSNYGEIQHTDLVRINEVTGDQVTAGKRFLSLGTINTLFFLDERYTVHFY